MKRYLFGLIVSLVFLPGPALADFSGLYGGVELGYANVDVDVDIQDAGETSIDGDDLKYGGFLGYRYSLLGIVVGAEARLSDTTNESDISAVDFTASTSSSREFGVSGIVGYAPPAGGFMVFGILGYENLKAKMITNGMSESNSNGGIRYGAGIELGLLPMVSVRGTVSRTEYGNQFNLDAVTNLGAQSDFTQTEATVGAVLSF